MHQDILCNNTLCNQYSLNLSRVIKRGIRYKRRNGEWCGKAPLGYRNIHDSNDHFKPKIVIDPEPFDRVRKAFKLMQLGCYTVSEVSKIVKLDSNFLRRALKNPFYAGLNKDVDYPSITYRGNWEPMVTKEEFDRVQKILMASSKKAKRQNVINGV